MRHDAYSYILAVTGLITALTALIHSLRIGQRVAHVRQRVENLENKNP